MTFFEGVPHGVGLGELDGDGGVGAVVAELGAAGDLDAVLGDVLREEFGAGRGLQVVGRPGDAGHGGGLQGCLDGLFPHGGGVRQADTERGQDTGHGGYEHGPDAEQVGHCARVLSAGAAEGGQGVAGDVVALLHGDPLDRVGDVGDGDVQVALGDLFGGAVVAGALPDLAREGGEAVPDERRVQGLVAVGTEHLGEVAGLDPAEHDVGVGDGERAARAVAGGARVRARRVRPYAVAGAVEVEDRAAAGRDGVDVEHGCPEPDTGDLRGEDAFVLAGEVGHVGGGTAHVEADDAVEAGELRHAGHAGDAARGPGQDRVLATELAGFGESSVGLHEHQPHAVELVGDALHVAAQHRRQIGVDDRGVPAGNQFHQRADLAGQRDLRESDAGGQLPDGPFVAGMEVAVHADHGDGADAVVVGPAERIGEGVEVGGGQDGAVRGDALVDLDDPLVEEFGEFDAPGEDVGGGSGRRCAGRRGSHG
ncbi:hypothetical protein GCM10020295_69860 [Streptomyces cinereospinus]